MTADHDTLNVHRSFYLATTMGLINSTMLPLGTATPDFCLPNFDGRLISRDDFREKPALLVLFICNHCPYVKHVRFELAKIGKEYQSRGVAIVAINSNDAERYPADSPEQMKLTAAEAGYTFPYLFDESQAMAKAFRAACTPDVFLFNGSRRLVYRGQIDDSRPKTDLAVTGKDLRSALDAVLDNKPVSERQIPSIGCSIKWKPGNEPS